MPERDEERDKEELLALQAIFQRLLKAIEADEGQWEVLEELMSLRAQQLIDRALHGFGMTLKEALELLQSSEEGLDRVDKEKRIVIHAAIDNLVDFAVAEEYQMANDLEYDEDDSTEEDEDEEEEDDDDDDDDNKALKIFKTYNQRYGKVENGDVEYAMMVAAGLVAVRSTTILTYMTQGDERVRPWHLTYEGYTAPKSSFPHWLIPPIEHQCRCYLIEEDVYNQLNVQAARTDKLEMPDWFNPTFKESVAFGGRIFSDEHPYFQVDGAHADKLSEISARIKTRYFNA